MHHYEFVGIIGSLRVRVVLGRRAMSGPASVCNANMHVVLIVKVEILSTPNGILQSLHLALGSNDVNATVIGVKRDA